MTTMNLTEMRGRMIADLLEVSTAILLDPVAPKRAEAVTEALRQTLVAWQELVESTSTSSSVAYAYRDLNLIERERFEKAKHVLGLLQDRFGAKVMEA